MLAWNRTGRDVIKGLRMTRGRCFVIAFVAAMACVPASALANQTTISYSSSNNSLVVTTQSDDRNDIAITQEGNDYTFSENGVYGINDDDITLDETANPECTQPGGDVECTVAGLALIEVKLFRGSDTLDAQDFLHGGLNPVQTDMQVTTTDTAGDDSDSLDTGEGADTVDAGLGDDYINSYGGNDNLDGGPGEDSLDSGDGNNALYGGESSNASTSEDDDLLGGSGNDVLTGGAGDDTLDGSEGNDTYVADADPDGSDSISDFEGNDTADYSARTTPLYLSNDDNDVSGAVDGEGGIADADNIASEVETLIGGSAPDTLTGVGFGLPDLPNVMRGNGGADTIDGSDGSSADTIDYSNAPGAVTVNLATGVVSGSAGADDLDAIENVIGGSGNDILGGSAEVNAISAGLGNDTVNSRDGVADGVDCGGGSGDALTSDIKDSNVACESVDDGSSPPPPSPPDKDDDQATDSTAPKMSLASKTVKMSKKGTIKLKLKCPASEQGGCEGFVTLGKVQAGSAIFDRIDGGEKASVTVKLSSKARKIVKKGRKLAAKARITAHDDDDNSTTASVKLTIRR
jgi:Ca2+-binding RTX toxin-like protein